MAIGNTLKLIKFADSPKIPEYQIQIHNAAPADSPVFAIEGATVKFQRACSRALNDAVLQKSTVSMLGSTD